MQLPHLVWANEKGDAICPTSGIVFVARCDP